ncbi:MAG: hypothetical protein QME74_08805, partial [Candidatus Edwardsbacteria bacterium]|nr:hypothetical protein [Candidatus Edwardsbacteria bacterium]
GTAMSVQPVLKVKCPVCKKSLMDPRHRLDDQPSVGLEAVLPRLSGVNWGKRGWLRLSSVYGSYAIESEFPIPKDSVARLFCPKCKAELKSTVACELCLAPMIPQMLEEGGRIFICSRRGCRKHFLEFEDVDGALAKFYDTYTIAGGAAGAKRKTRKTHEPEPDPKEIVASGSFLQSYCPHCRHSLIDKGSLAFTVVSPRGKEGTLLLSPYLNVFTNKSTVEIPHGEEVRNLRCPHCSHTLIENPGRCGRCGSRIARITVGAMHKLISFYICLRKGCTWHGLSDDDTKLIMLEDSKEW